MFLLLDTIFMELGRGGVDKTTTTKNTKGIIILLIITIIVNCFILEMMFGRFFCVDNQS